jgi:CRISPR/Cas system-associated exonuclease Cas4 (RecB family)
MERNKMSLPEGFVFSQSNLQDYVDCQRRFQLRHILHQAWPAVEAEPYLENERLIDLGARFHKIVHQHLIGVPVDRISRSISGDDMLQSMWGNYLHAIKDGLLKIIDNPTNQRYEEITLSIAVEEFRLIAKYDLLVIRPDGKWTIVDWKTSQKHPGRRWLADRLQTHVYPFVLSGAGGRLINGEMIDPDQIEMVYWFANQPEQPEVFPYNQPNYQEDGRFLRNLVLTIDKKNEPIYPLTPDVKRCLFCTYRSLCNRGIKPGDLEHLEEWLEPESPDDVKIDFDQIGEIEF